MTEGMMSNKVVVIGCRTATILALSASLDAAAAQASAGSLPAIASATVGLGTRSEKVMRTDIAANTEYDIALLQRLVDQNSGTLNLEGVRRAGAIVRTELERLGFDVRWEDMAAVGRAGHLVATHKGSGRGKRVLLIGHLDTVFEADSPFQRFVRSGNRATGPGVGDDKGGIIVILAALHAMQAAGTLKAADVTVYLTGDEERTGLPLAISRRGLVEAGRQCDAALEYEGLASLGSHDFATVARRGAASWELRTTGRSGHSSRVFGPGAGYGAIYEMARILSGFASTLVEPDVTFNVGVVAGGAQASLDVAGLAASASGKTNVIAESAVARGDLRTLTVEQDSRVRSAMRMIVAKHLPGTGAELTFSDDKAPMAPTARNRDLLAELNVVNRELGLETMLEVPPSERGAADSGFVSKDVATLGGLGVAGAGSHAVGEAMELGSIQRQALRSAALISRLTSQPR